MHNTGYTDTFCFTVLILVCSDLSCGAHLPGCVCHCGSVQGGGAGVDCENDGSRGEVGALGGVAVLG